MAELTQFLGIDLGTTNSVAASVDASGRPMVLRNPAGAETVPSVVHFVSAGAVVVGDQARELAAMDPAHTVALVKRLMGTDRLFEFHGAEHTPESVSALILRAIVDGVLPNRDGTPVPAVITVPAYFGIREREATQQAGLLAGLRVLELVSEPVAAALHYRPRGDGPIVVYDLGGGTFDVTVLRVDGGSQVVAVDGDMDLGGADWDQRLRAHLLDRFVEKVGPARDPAEDAAFMTELTLVAERVKKALTHTRTHEVALRHDGATARVTVTRDEFAAMTRDLTDRTGDCVRRILATAGLAAGDVADCLLVGGSTRMPQIASALRESFGWSPRSHDPDLAVAKGAALRAWQLVDADPAWVTPGWATDPVAARPSTSSSPTPAATVPFLSSVVPRSFGLLIHDSSDPAGRRQHVQHVIHQNEPLPADGHELTVATILDDQAAVRIEVYEQAGFVESAEVGDNRRVLDGELAGLPAGLKAGSPLIIALHLGLDGRLRVTAREPRSRAELSLEAYVDGVLDGNDRLQQAQRLARLTVRQ